MLSCPLGGLSASPAELLSRCHVNLVAFHVHVSCGIRDFADDGDLNTSSSLDTPKSLLFACEQDCCRNFHLARIPALLHLPQLVHILLSSSHPVVENKSLFM